MSTTTFTGLPIIGFGVQTFFNGTLTDASNRLIQSSYGGNFVHKYKKTFAPVPTHRLLDPPIPTAGRKTRKSGASAPLFLCLHVGEGSRLC